MSNIALIEQLASINDDQEGCENVKTLNKVGGLDYLIEKLNTDATKGLCGTSAVDNNRKLFGSNLYFHS